MAKKPLNWDDLRYFLHAVRAGSLAGAARSLDVEHSTIGRRLTSLEDTLGASLVLRRPEGVRLTPLGDKLAPLVDDLERSITAVRDLVAAENARVRLAVPSGFTKLFTAGLARLRREHPDLSLELVSGARPVALEDGEADLAIRAGTLRGDDLVARKLCVSGWALYAADPYLARRGAPRDPEDLRGHEIIGFDPALSKVAAAKWIERHATGATIVLRSREMTDMVAAAAAGVGLAVLPCLIGDAERELHRLTPGVVASHNVSLVYRRDALRSDNVRAVVRFVIDIFREHADRIGGRRADAIR